MPGPLITRRDISTGAVTTQRRRFDRVTGGIREARVHFIWPTANLAISMPHPLRKTPTRFTVVKISRNTSGSGAGPGVVYAPVVPQTASSSATGSEYNFTKTNISLTCTTANTWAEIVIS